MADTTYNSLGVDEVAAQHVNAQCIVSLSDCIWTDLRILHIILWVTTKRYQCYCNVQDLLCPATVFVPGHDILKDSCSRSLASTLCAGADTLWARLPEPALKAAGILRLHQAAYRLPGRLKAHHRVG